MASGDEAQGGRKGGKPDRAERLEAALKANLKKRKEQARARARSDQAAVPQPAPDDDPDT